MSRSFFVGSSSTSSKSEPRSSPRGGPAGSLDFHNIIAIHLQHFRRYSVVLHLLIMNMEAVLVRRGLWHTGADAIGFTNFQKIVDVLRPHAHHQAPHACGRDDAIVVIEHMHAHEMRHLFDEFLREAQTGRAFSPPCAHRRIRADRSLSLRPTPPFTFGLPTSCRSGCYAHRERIIFASGVIERADVMLKNGIDMALDPPDADPSRTSGKTFSMRPKSSNRTIPFAGARRHEDLHELFANASLL